MKKNIAYILFFVLLPLLVWAAVTTITMSGNWNDPLIWSSGNVADDISEDVTMNNSIGVVTIQSDESYTIAELILNNDNTLKIDEGGSLTIGSIDNNQNLVTHNKSILHINGSLEVWGNLNVNNNLTLNVTGILILHGNLDVKNNSSINIEGNVTIEGDFIAGDNTEIIVDGILDVSGDIDIGIDSSITGQGTVSIAGECINTGGFCDDIPVDAPIEDLSVIFYKVFTPNGDNINDYWVIGNIENYPTNTVNIYDRLGGVVYRANGYDNQAVVWKGFSNQSGQPVLPSGTYYYNIVLDSSSAVLQGFVELVR